MIEALVAGLFGLLIGSFLNVCIYRLPRDLSVVKPRSFCPECDKTIAWYDNIPVVSWLLLGGKCRGCRTPIHWRYPLVELITGALFFVAFLYFKPLAAAVRACIFFAIMVDLVVTDFEERILPDEFTIGGAAVGLAYSLIHPVPSTLLQTFFLPQEWDPRWKSFAEALFGCLFASGALWAIGTIYKIVRHREGLGFGDVKMVAMIGAFLGIHPTLATLILGSLLGSVVGLAFILLAKKDAASYELPFGSFLGIAAVVILFLAANQG